MFGGIYRQNKHFGLGVGSFSLGGLGLVSKINFVEGEYKEYIIRVCMEFCNFCKVLIWKIFPQKTLKLGRVAFHSLTFQF